MYCEFFSRFFVHEMSFNVNMNMYCTLCTVVRVLVHVRTVNEQVKKHGHIREHIHVHVRVHVRVQEQVHFQFEYERSLI